MRVTDKTYVILTQYSLLSHEPEVATSYKYIGIHFTSSLTWNESIDPIILNASRKLAFLRRTLCQAPQETRLLAYKTTILPKLEYANIIWSPHQIYLVKNLVFRKILLSNQCHEFKTKSGSVFFGDKKEKLALVFFSLNSSQ